MRYSKYIQPEWRKERNLKVNLHIHHIDYNKKNTKMNNCISLCNSYHMKTNVNRKYWKNEFLKVVEL